MKKTWFLAVLTILLGTNAFGDCKVTVCSPGGGSDKSILSTTGVVGNNATGQCYRCNWGDNDYECGEGTIIAIKHQDYAFNKQIKSFFYCSDAGSHNDTWVNHNPSETCKDSPMPSSAQNTEKYFAIDGNKTGDIKSEAGDSLVLANGAHGCVMYKCKYGYRKDPSGKNCIVDTRNSNCKTTDGNTHPNGHTLQQECKSANNVAKGKGKLESLEHIKANAKCTMTCATNGWDLTLNNDSCETRYGPNAAKKKCIKTQAAINDDNAAAARRNKCTNSGGTWSGGKCICSAEKNLRLSNGECVCTNENYERSGDKCVLTDIAQEKKDCEDAASMGAYWQDGECKCKNPQHEWRAKKCQLKADIAECNKITGAHWVNNECKCKNANQEINAERTKCEMSANFTVTQDVNNAYSQLTAIHNKFRDNVSVWKDAEGNFNTARLASDTVAGVVLGTTGALVTSHVVKKNQVENGFEDIKCTIGGQNVAGWGDQFRVGIQ
jgi:hypothetical protein